VTESVSKTTTIDIVEQKKGEKQLIKRNVNQKDIIMPKFSAIDIYGNHSVLLFSHGITIWRLYVTLFLGLLP